MKRAILLAVILYQSSLLFCSAQQNTADSFFAAWQDAANPDSIRVNSFQEYIMESFLFSNPDSAYILTSQLLVYATENNYPPAKAIAYELRGHCYFVQGLYPKAVDEYQRSLKLYKEIGDQFGAGSVLQSLGKIYTETKDYPKAIAYFEESMQHLKKPGNQGNIASSLINLAGVYIDTKEYDKAIEIFEQSLVIAESIGDEPRMASIWGNYGFIYLKQKKYAESLLYSYKALEVFEKYNNEYAIIIGLSNLGQALLGQGKVKEGIENCDKSLTMAIEIGATLEQIEACNCVYTGYKTQGNLAKALEYHERLLIFTGNLEREETTNKLQKIEFEKQLLQDSIQTAENTRLVEEAYEEQLQNEAQNRNAALITGGFILLLAIGLYGRLRYTRKAKTIIEKEKDRSEELLLNILPADVAEELKATGTSEARDYDNVTVLFTDFQGFTSTAEKLSAKDLVGELNHCFKAFDDIMTTHGLEKIKTIGDAYMAAGGLKVPQLSEPKDVIHAALEMQNLMQRRKEEQNKRDKPSFEMRVGIHTGPVVAGIVGVKKFQYDIWGDTVNTASRMESAGEVGKVNISQATYELLKDDPDFAFESRGKIEAKGKGEMEMYFVIKTESPDDHAKA